jgi:hypothetical protein
MILDHERLDVGKHSKADKRRYYVSARGSATESAALLDVLSRLALLDGPATRAARRCWYGWSPC